MKPHTEKQRNGQIAIFGTLTVLVILFIIGRYIYKAEPIVIQGEAETDEIRVASKIPGRIKSIRVEEGSEVKAGDTLAILSSPELTAKLDQASAAENAALALDRKAKKGAREELVTGAYETWQKALIGVDIAKKSYDRVQHLFDKGVVTAQKRDEAEAQYLAAVATANAAKSQYDMAVNGTEKEDIDAAMASVERAKGAKEEVEAYLDETILTSPMDGEISEIFPECGELVGTGAPIMNLVSMDKTWFTFNVREDLLGDMKMGSKFVVKIPALNNENVEVEVFYIKALASYATWKTTKATGQFDAKTFEVRARPVTHVADLRPGMSAIVNKNLN
jgi:HlyD family secretion protein